jgi:hypothetical protein
MNSDSRIYNKLTDFVWRVPFSFSIDIFINQDEKTIWFDFDLRLSPFVSFLLMLISTHWMRCENWCCCLFTLLKNSQTLREEEALIANTTNIHMRVSMYIVNLFDVKQSKWKKKSKCLSASATWIDEQTKKKENDEHLVCKSKQRYLLFFFFIAYIRHQSVVLLEHI